MHEMSDRRNSPLMVALQYSWMARTPDRRGICISSGAISRLSPVTSLAFVVRLSRQYAAIFSGAQGLIAGISSAKYEGGPVAVPSLALAPTP